MKKSVALTAPALLSFGLESFSLADLFISN